MALTTLQKQPWEERIFVFNFTNDMDPEEIISDTEGVDVVAVSSGSNTLVVSGLTASGQSLSTKFAGGTTGQTYTIRARVVTSLGQKLELDGKLQVKEL